MGGGWFVGNKCGYGMVCAGEHGWELGARHDALVPPPITYHQPPAEIPGYQFSPDHTIVYRPPRGVTFDCQKTSQSLFQRQPPTSYPPPRVEGLVTLATWPKMTKNQKSLTKTPQKILVPWVLTGHFRSFLADPHLLRGSGAKNQSVGH